MKKIEEAAKKYARRIWAGGKREFGSVLKYSAQDFLAGAEYIREELTRWHDPDNPPSDNRDVLVKTTSCQKYEIAFFKAKGFRNYHWHTNNGSIDDDMVIGWREIPE